jgi:hypothetical protein
MLDSPLARAYKAAIFPIITKLVGGSQMEQTKGQEVRPGSRDDAVAEKYAVVGAPDDKRKRKKKRGSSRSARRLEDVEKRVSKATRRVSKAVDRGVVTYREKRDKSARKRRDGALVDFHENVTRGVVKAVSKSSPALTIVAKALNSKRVRRGIRRAVRSIPVP